jgi:hypothetical protein
MIVYEEKIATVKKKVRTEIKCDICNQTIVNKSMKPRYYYTVRTGHYEWGNDSIDSIEHKDICSDFCLQKAFVEYLDEVKSSPSAYFDIEREWGKIEEYKEIEE